MNKVPSWVQLKKRYTHSIKRDNKYIVRLAVGVQSFDLVGEYTYAEAEWYRKMLAKALVTFIKEMI